VQRASNSDAKPEKVTLYFLTRSLECPCPFLASAGGFTRRYVMVVHGTTSSIGLKFTARSVSLWIWVEVEVKNSPTAGPTSRCPRWIGPSSWRWHGAWSMVSEVGRCILTAPQTAWSMASEVGRCVLTAPQTAGWGQPALPCQPTPRLAGCSLHAPGSSFPLAGSSLQEMGRHPGRFLEHPAPGSGVLPSAMEHPAGRSGVSAACGVFPPPRMEHPASSMDHPGRRREHPGRNGAAQKPPKSAILASKAAPMAQTPV
jgi:hypothetical protein